MRSRARAVLTLESFAVGGDLALFALRLWIAVVLVLGVSDELLDPARMRACADLLGRHGFAAPAVFAWISVTVRLVCGVAFGAGLATRWAGLFGMVYSLVAIVMVDRLGGTQALFPSVALLLFSAYMATHGPGRYALDNILVRRRRVW